MGTLGGEIKFIFYYRVWSNIGKSLLWPILKYLSLITSLIYTIYGEIERFVFFTDMIHRKIFFHVVSNLSVSHCGLNALAVSQPCHILATWSCSSHFIFLIPNILIYKDGNITNTKAIILFKPNVMAKSFFFFFFKRRAFKNSEDFTNAVLPCSP